MKPNAKSSKGEGSGQNTTLQFCSFWVAERLFGIDILDIKEVCPFSETVPIFHSKKQIKGCMNLRGQTILIIDMRKLLGFSEEKAGPENRVLVFKSEIAEPCGVLVDKIGDVVEATDTQIEERRKAAQGAKKDERRSMSGDFTEGVCRLENALMIVIKAKGLLNHVSEKDRG